jgi:NAD-dependent SIR2 family protein deacetylase
MRLEKTKTVFVLGAGASVDSGCPVMKDFLDRAYYLRRYTDRDVEMPSFELVFEAISQLQSVFAKSKLELLNIESAFAAFEMAQLFGRLGTLDKEQLGNLTHAIRVLIVDTLEWSMKFRRVQNNVRAPVSYDIFANKIQELLSDQKHDVTLMTFNYDIGLDYALFTHGLKFDYGLVGPPAEDRTLLLKLHGSINWARCPNCKALEVVEFDKVALQEAGRDDPIYMRLRQACQGHKVCHGISREIAIVPPTWNKTQHYQEIAQVWQAAAQRLSEAENIVIMGYSLPATDEFFRYLFALGTVGTARLQRVIVFNPDSEVDMKYKSLLGPMALQRYQLIAAAQGYFDAAVQQVIPRLAT